MNKLQQMKADLENNPELQKKFEEAKKAAVENGVKSDIEVLVNAAEAIGYDITAVEFEKDLAEAQMLSEEELSRISGGVEDEYGHDDWCAIFWHCYVTFAHTETKNPKVTCWKDYGCKGNYNGWV